MEAAPNPVPKARVGPLRSINKGDHLSKALHAKGRSFPAWCFLYIVPLDPALKGGDYGVLSGQIPGEIIWNFWENPFSFGFSLMRMGASKKLI
jgi:hypothetical protein